MIFTYWNLKYFWWIF